jgi:predicted ester cyclase
MAEPEQRYGKDGRPIDYIPNACAEKGGEFFRAVLSGEGAHIAKKFCIDDADATFECGAFSGYNTIEQYATFMQGLTKQICPDSKYTITSLCSNEEEVMVMGTLSGTHTGEGGPLTPCDPPRKFKVEFAARVHFDEYDKITHCSKVFDKYSLWSQLGWPLPGVD